jgi:hypothetical protein
VYTGHVAVALLGKASRTRIPLWLLVLAAQACDWLDIVADALLHRRDHVMLTHSLAAILVCAPVVGAAALWLTRSRGAALLVTLVYLTHLPLDYVTGLKPTWPGGPMLGLAIYDRPLEDFALEGLMVLFAWAAYCASLRSPRPRAALAALLLSLLLLQLAGDLAFATRASWLTLLP